VDLEDAYQQQLSHWRASLSSGAQRIGWKIGFNPPAVQEKLGLSEPVVGHLTSATLLGADGSHSLAGAENPLAEPEIAIEIGRDQSIAGLAAAIEIVDIPALPEGPDEVGDVVAANIFHRAVAIGPSAEVDSAEGIEANFSINGQVARTASAATVDLQGTVELVARVLEGAGERLEAGDRIIAGALAPPPEISAGGTLNLDLGALGSLEVSLTH
jgi:2-keto-4-pentenoate hydratase